MIQMRAKWKFQIIWKRMKVVDDRDEKLHMQNKIKMGEMTIADNAEFAWQFYAVLLVCTASMSTKRTKNPY